MACLGLLAELTDRPSPRPFPPVAFSFVHSRCGVGDDARYSP